MNSQILHIGMIRLKALIIISIILSGTLVCKAQLNPFQSMYYQNPYLYNPAMAGITTGLNLNLGYRQQWSNFPGAPKTSAFTLDYQPTEKVGLGLNINDDRTGLIRQTRVMGTYAYHLPLNGEDKKLSFGISLGINNSRVDYNNIAGDITDDEISRYNQLKPYLDGDLGMAYTSNSLNIGAALPNLKTVFFKSSDERFDADRMIFIAVTSYKIPLQSDDREFILEPLVGYRMVKGYKDIYDAGVNFTLSNYGLNFQGIYIAAKTWHLASVLISRFTPLILFII